MVLAPTLAKMYPAPKEAKYHEIHITISNSTQTDSKDTIKISASETKLLIQNLQKDSLVNDKDTIKVNIIKLISNRSLFYYGKTKETN